MERIQQIWRFRECDLLINIGARFDDRLTGNLETFAPNAKVIHIDIDPAEIGKNVPTEIPIVADAKEALESIVETRIRITRNSRMASILKRINRGISIMV